MHDVESGATPLIGQAAPAVTFTLEEAFAYGMAQHREGNLDEAEKVYAALLQRQPGRADVVNVLGILKHQQGDLAAAAGLLRRVVELEPAADGVWNNLGNVLLALGDADEAALAFKRSLELVPTPDAWANLARVFRRRREWTLSQQACLQALALAPEHGPATHNLALALLLEGRTAPGVEVALRAMQLLQPSEQRRQVYSQILLQSGQPEQAAVILRAWQAQDPDNPFVRHHLAACTGEHTPERASDAYVEMMFDRAAPSFDAKLARLRYQGPQAVADALAQRLPPPARQFDVADLGCGTGLCGPLLRPWARRLAGCDLSGAMLARAHERGAYDELHREELTAFLRARREAFDLVVCADTLNYFGDLRDVANAVAGALRPGATVVFTLEALAANAARAYKLQENGRYAHDGAHARRVFEAAGLHVDAPVEMRLRDEAEAPVPAWLMVARRPA